jgi:hypothetical protein
MASSDLGATGPRILLAYYTFTHQTLSVVEAIAEVLRQRGCEVRLAGIEFTDARYMERFTRFPLRHAVFDILGMLPAQLRRATGEIQIPEEAREGDYDMVCIGAPTWWLTTCMPIRSYLNSEAAAKVLAGTRFTAFVVCRRYWRSNLKSVRALGTKHGGEYIDGIHFKFAGGQVRSLLSLISYLGSGQDRERYLGVRIPRTNLQADYLQQAQAFANQLADRLDDERHTTERNGA